DGGLLTAHANSSVLARAVRAARVKSVASRPAAGWHAISSGDRGGRRPLRSGGTHRAAPWMALGRGAYPFRARVGGHESSRGSDRCTPRAVGSGRQAPQSPSLPGPRIAPGLPGVVPAARPEGDVGPQSPFEQAVRQHQAGDLIGAERNYLQTLALDPAHADAWCNLGVLQSARSRPAEAAECYRRRLPAPPPPPPPPPN